MLDSSSGSNNSIPGSCVVITAMLSHGLPGMLSLENPTVPMIFTPTLALIKTGGPFAWWFFSGYMFSHHQNYSRAMVFNLFHVTCMMSEDNGHGYVHARSWTICSVPGDWIQSRSLLGGVRFWGNTSNIIRRILGWAPKTIYFFSYVYIYIYIYRN